jgi:type II secretory pathway component PulK
MRNFLATLRRSSGIATLIALTTLAIAVVSGAVLISSLISRVEKLELDLGRSQARIVELAASQSRLSAGIDAADQSIKSLRSYVDHPRLQPLASILDARP